MVQSDQDNVLDVDGIGNRIIIEILKCGFSFLKLLVWSNSSHAIVTMILTLRKATSRFATSLASFSLGMGFGTFLESLVLTYGDEK
jgi:hypothetical protein